MDSTTTPISAVVLTGGHSSRMGTDKAWLPHPESGESLLLRQLALLRGLNPASLLVSARSGQSLPLLPPDITRVDDDGQSGPMAGIAASLEQIETDYLLVVAVDLPALSRSPLESMVAQIETDRGVIARSPHGLEPLVGIYPRSLLPELQSALATSQNALQHWLKQPAISSRFTISPFTDSTEFTNWNSPGQDISNEP